MLEWNLPLTAMEKFRELIRKKKQKLDKIKIFSYNTYWKYYSFMDSCGSNAHFSDEGHVKNLEMMEGEYYDNDTLYLIERPLMSAIADYRRKMKREKIEASAEYDNLGLQMIQEMKLDRKNTRSTDPVRITKLRDAMRKRYGK
jgi:hypothetical protein